MIENDIDELREIIHKLCKHKEVKVLNELDNGNTLLLKCVLCGKEDWLKVGKRKWFGKIVKMKVKE